MDISTNTDKFNHSDTAHFNGIPCRVFNGVDVILDKLGKTTREFVESEEFQMLEGAGIEVHSGAFG